jgi:polysaccharide deacetylase 2 family uncharacterized protein YibQ
MDDLGFRIGVVETLLSLKIPMVFSVLPGVRYTLAVAERVEKAGYDLFLHQPMEPEGYPVVDPGPFALLTRDSTERLREILDKNLSLPVPFSGINNHMGSRFTADERAMRVVFEEIKKRGIIYLDSLTTPRSVAPHLCRALELLCIFRDVFLDHTLKEEEILKRIEEWRRIAEERGVAIAIAHPHPRTLSILSRTVPLLVREGYRFVGVKEIRFWLQYGGYGMIARKPAYAHE